jgi:hypothetical protein
MTEPRIVVPFLGLGILINRVEKCLNSIDFAYLNEEIATFLWGAPLLNGNVGTSRTLCWWFNGLGYEVPPNFMGSLDAALLVYMKLLPDMISSNPMEVVLDALRNRDLRRNVRSLTFLSEET